MDEVVGRQSELVGVVKGLKTDGFAAIVGGHGVGKTALAQEYVARASQKLTNVWTITDATSLRTAATAVGASVATDASDDDVALALRRSLQAYKDKTSFLVVFDGVPASWLPAPAAARTAAAEAAGIQAKQASEEAKQAKAVEAAEKAEKDGADPKQAVEALAQADAAEESKKVDAEVEAAKEAALARFPDFEESFDATHGVLVVSATAELPWCDNVRVGPLAPIPAMRVLREVSGGVLAPHVDDKASHTLAELLGCQASLLVAAAKLAKAEQLDATQVLAKLSEKGGVSLYLAEAVSAEAAALASSNLTPAELRALRIIALYAAHQPILMFLLFDRVDVDNDSDSVVQSVQSLADKSLVTYQKSSGSYKVMHTVEMTRSMQLLVHEPVSENEQAALVTAALELAHSGTSMLGNMIGGLSGIFPMIQPHLMALAKHGMRLNTAPGHVAMALEAVARFLANSGRKDLTEPVRLVTEAVVRAKSAQLHALVVSLETQLANWFVSANMHQDAMAHVEQAEAALARQRKADPSLALQATGWRNIKRARCDALQGLDKKAEAVATYEDLVDHDAELQGDARLSLVVSLANLGGAIDMRAVEAAKRGDESASRRFATRAIAAMQRSEGELNSLMAGMEKGSAVLRDAYHYLVGVTTNLARMYKRAGRFDECVQALRVLVAKLDALQADGTANPLHTEYARAKYQLADVLATLPSEGVAAATEAAALFASVAEMSNTPADCADAGERAATALAGTKKKAKKRNKKKTQQAGAAPAAGHQDGDEAAAVPASAEVKASESG